MPGDVRRRWDGAAASARSMRPAEQVQRHDLRRRPQPDRLRARDLHAWCASGRTGGARCSPRISTGRSSTARTMSASSPTARSISPIPGTAACRSTASSGRASSASRASIACRRAAGSRNCWSTAICSTSRTGCASRRTRSCSTSTTPCKQLIRVFDVDADGTLAQRPDVRQRHRLGHRARRARRHEMRRARQCLGHGAGRRLGLFAERQTARQGARARAGRQSDLGRPGFAHALHHRDALGLHGADQGRAAPRALYARRPTRAGRGAAGAGRA